jgi:hypothetical protein
LRGKEGVNVFTLTIIDYLTQKIIFSFLCYTIDMCLNPFYVYSGVLSNSIYHNSQVFLEDGIFYTYHKEQMNHLNYSLTKKQVFPVDCYKCVACKQKKQRDIMLRSYLHQQGLPKGAKCWFLTLTYDWENIPYVDKKTGEIKFGLTTDFKDKNGEKQIPTLYLKDHQLFVKRLRRFFDYNYNHSSFKYLAAGEYGDKNGRPHLHYVLWDAPIKDSVFFRQEKGKKVFVSNTIKRLWNKGLFHLSSCNSLSVVNYVSGYVMKKKEKNYYKVNNQYPEFVKWSHQLARSYLLNNFDSLLQNPYIHVPYTKKPLLIPKYFFNVIKKISLDSLYNIFDFKPEYRDHKFLKIQHLTLSNFSDFSNLDLVSLFFGKADLFYKKIQDLNYFKYLDLKNQLFKKYSLFFKQFCFDNDIFDIKLFYQYLDMKKVEILRI